MATIKEFMAEERIVDRWLILKVGLAGGFAGACLAVLITLLAISS